MDVCTQPIYKYIGFIGFVYNTYICKDVYMYFLSSICQEIFLVLQHHLELPVTGRCENYS